MYTCQQKQHLPPLPSLEVRNVLSGVLIYSDQISTIGRDYNLP